MRYTLQVFTGNFDSPPPSAQSVISAIRHAAQQLPASDVILGWNADRGLYEAVLPAILEMGLRAWLWLPVFSEVSERESPAPAVSYRGVPQQGVQTIPGEDFRFICPSSRANQDTVLRTYHRHFAELPWHGVFLDKVRHASFAEGFDGGFGCFCDACRTQYRRKGVDAQAIARRIAAEPAAMLPNGWTESSYAFADIDVTRFYQAKMDLVTAAVRRIATAFRAQGLAVGLDVFAPSLAPMVGQDLAALGQMADFIKPMLYCITHAPAGIPFETEAYRRSFAEEGHVDASDALRSIWRGACNGDRMDYRRELAQTSKDAVHPGFEINVMPGVCHSTPAYVTHVTRALDAAGITQAVLSWNLLLDAGDNIRALAEESAGQ